MTESNINIVVQLNDDKVPQQITWSASGSPAESPQKAKALFIAFWDAVDKSALRIDLWTKDMMIDEMADFYYQVLTTMGESFQRATKHDVLSDDIKSFAKDFHKKFIDIEMERNKAGTL
ncbi:MAG: gliding motility protein GldC [Ginsengibacter sp.]